MSARVAGDLVATERRVGWVHAVPVLVRRAAPCGRIRARGEVDRVVTGRSSPHVIRGYPQVPSVFDPHARGAEEGDVVCVQAVIA